MEAARRRQAMLAKPPGSLGELENISIRLAGVTGQVKNTVSPTRIYVLAADNGVVAEGVSSAPQSVTLAQSINLTRGLTGASSLARHFGDGLVVVDMKRGLSVLLIVALLLGACAVPALAAAPTVRADAAAAENPTAPQANSAVKPGTIVAPNASFSDISGHANETAILSLASYGILNGMMNTV